MAVQHRTLMSQLIKLLFTPKWIALSLVTLTLIPTFKALSDWQWRRLDQRISFNSELESEVNLPAVPFTQLSPDGKFLKATDMWHPVTAKGIFLIDQQYLVRKKSLNAQAGLWVVTPLKLNNGKIITVVRGWVPAGEDAKSSPQLTAIKATPIELVGRLRQISSTNLSEPNDLPIGQRLSIDPKYGNAYLELVTSNPNLQTPEITPIPLPELTEGPHRSYAIQWLIFIVMLIGGYLILLRNDLIGQSELS